MLQGCAVSSSGNCMAAIQDQVEVLGPAQRQTAGEGAMIGPNGDDRAAFCCAVPATDLCMRCCENLSHAEQMRGSAALSEPRFYQSTGKAHASVLQND